MKITLELSEVIDATSKVGMIYQVSNVKIQHMDVDTILNTKLTSEENAKYAAMAEAMANYYAGLALALRPVD